jgi:flagellar biosynthesis anti-sigma factor FlgM
MKVNGSDGAAGIRGILQRMQRGEEIPRDRRMAPQEDSSGAKVEISQEAREIHNLKAVLNDIPDVREKKVEEIRDLIQKGNYKVDLDRVSDRILKAVIFGDL